MSKSKVVGANHDLSETVGRRIASIREPNNKNGLLVKQTLNPAFTLLSKTWVDDINKHSQRGRRAAHCALNSSH